MGGSSDHTYSHPCCYDANFKEIKICCAGEVDSISIKMRNPEDKSPEKESLQTLKRSITEIECWGGNGGTAWTFLPPEGGITKIIVRSGGAIDSLSFVGLDRTGKPMISRQFGSKGGKPHEVTLDWPNEYLTGISGTVGNFGGFRVIRSLELVTNQGKRHGRFGIADGTNFSLSMKGSAIVGFHGRHGGLVDGVGVYITPTP